MNLNKDFLEKYDILMNEDVELALEFSLNALKESNNVDFCAYVADCYMSLEDYDKAIEILKEALYKKCNNATYAKSLLGESLFYLSRFEESKTVFEDLKLENPDSFFVSAYLIDININLAKYDEAIKIGKDILNANTLDKNDTAYILVNLGWINLKYLNNIDESLEYFNKALKVDENIGRAYIGLGEYYFIIGEYNKALVNFEKAIDMQEGTIDVYFKIALCYKALKQYEDALSYMNIVHEADPTNEIYVDELNQLETL